MIHSVQQTYANFADREHARATLATLLRAEACVAARVVASASVWPWRVEAIWPAAPALPSACRVGISEVLLRDFERGAGWAAWRRTASLETAIEIGRLLRCAGVPWDCASRAAARVAAELYFRAEGALVEDCARLICELALRDAAPRRAS